MSVRRHAEHAPAFVEAAAEVAQKRVRPAEHPRPGERLEPARRAQPALQMLMVALDPLLDGLAGLVRDGRKCGDQRLCWLVY